MRNTMAGIHAGGLAAEYQQTGEPRDKKYGLHSERREDGGRAPGGTTNPQGTGRSQNAVVGLFVSRQDLYPARGETKALPGLETTT